MSYELTGAAKEPPCPSKSSTIPVWVDRMQIQDGTGREADAEIEPTPATSASPAPSGTP